MRYAIVLITSAVLVTACALPNTVDFGHSAPQRPLANDMPTMRAAPDPTPWTAYRTFSFRSTTADLLPSDLPQIREIVAYLNQNPSLDVATDGTLTANDTSASDRSLGNRRATSVRRALMDTDAGIASYRIFNGAIADPASRHAGQIQVQVGPRTGASPISG